MDDLTNDQIIGELKDSTRCIAFYATLLGKGVSEIGRAVSLSEWYGLSVRVSQPEFLAEIIDRPVDEGIAAGRAELKRQADEKKAFQDERTKFQAEADRERKRLAGVAHDYKAAEAALATLSSELASRENQLGAREARLHQVEDLEAAKCSVEQERAAVQEFLAAEIQEANATHGKRNAELESRATRLAAGEKRLAAAQASYRSTKRRAFAFQLVVFCVLASAAFLPVRERILKPYLDARLQFKTQETELAARENRLAALRDSLAEITDELKSWIGVERRREAEVQNLDAEIKRREQALASGQQALVSRERTLASQEHGQAERQSALNAQAADISRRSRDAQAVQAQLDQRAAGLTSAEEQVRAQAADVARQGQAVAAREQAIAAQEQALAAREQESRRIAQSVAAVQVQVASDARDVVAVAGSVGGASFRLTGPGVASFALHPGRQSYTVTVRSRIPGPYGWRLVDWSGSGVVDVPTNGGAFLVRGVYPRLWLERR